MDLPLVRTKLHMPASRPTLVLRPHLIARLNAGLQHTILTLIAAPAGFGKTTLAVSWLRQCERPTAWLSLDESDNDSTRFWRAVIASLQTVSPALGNVAAEMLDSPQPPALDAIVVRLINDLVESDVTVVLALDDYHLITNDDIHTSLNLLLDHAPTGLHVCVTTRADPPLQLARRRARADVTDIRAIDLRLAHDEAATFLRDIADISISDDDVAQLEARTEGWIAGLQMAALSLRDRSTAGMHAFVTTFAGDDRYIADYLVDEVLSQQPAHVQQFLLHTSLLARLSAPLCDAVTARDDSCDLLTLCEQSNLFVVPLDSRRGWYRYHHLFAELLRGRLASSAPDLVPELHRRAGRWFAENDMPDEAMRHVLAVDAYDEAADLLEATFWEKIQRGEQATLRRWLDAIPPAERHARPVLAYLYAWVLLFTGDVTSYEMPLTQAEDGWRDAGDEQGLARVLAFRANIARLKGDGATAIVRARQALDAVPAEDTLHRDLATMTLASGYVLAGDVRVAEPALAKARQLSETTSDRINQLISMNRTGDVQHMQARLHAAAGTYREVLRRAGERPLWQNVEARTALADLHREWNDLDTAQSHLDRAFELAQQTHREAYLARAYRVRAGVQVARGQMEPALESLTTARDLARRFNHADVVRQIDADEARIRLLQGDIAGALRWAAGIDIDAAGDYGREHEILTVARVRLAQGQPATARYLCEKLRRPAEAAGRTDSVLRILVMQALAHHLSDEAEQAQVALEQVLDRAQPAGYIRLFLDEGEPMLRLLTATFAAGRFTSYVDMLVESFDRQPAPVHWPRLFEPLTDREREVLQLVAAGATNREIAEELIIALTTAKKHVSNIIGKLEVSNRTEAANRARELGLL